MEEQINEIKDALRALMEMIVQRNQPLDEQMRKMLMQVLDHAANRIAELRQSEAVNQPPTQAVPELQPGPYPSSNVNSFKYDPENQRLFVKFHGEKTANSGPVYSYDGVPQFVFDIFSRGGVAPRTSGRNRYHQWVKGVTPSLGASMYALIKNGGYNYNRLT